MATLLERIDAWWRAANYLSVGQIYLRDNPRLTQPLVREHIKARLLGHWGTTPGLNFVYAHLNRVIRERELSMIYIAGPGHGGPGLIANAYLEGTYSEVYPDISQDTEGMGRLFKQFSFPGGVPSHVAPETPGSIHEGGELGYALSHAYGAAFDNPKLEELTALLRGYGHAVHFVEGDEPHAMHEQMAQTLDRVFADIARIQSEARERGSFKRPTWPMLVLVSPKGWTGPKQVDGLDVEGTPRAHQVPIAAMDRPEHVHLLESWMKSYRPEGLFDEAGALIPELRELAPQGELRMSANPHANGGALLRELQLPDFRRYAVEVPSPGAVEAEATRVQGELIRDVIEQNNESFRVFSPDETASNRWGAVFDATDRVSVAEILPSDEHVAPDGRVMEMLSEHQCQGWLEGYLLTGRHGFFSCYEAFIHIVDSMFNQHAKWLKVTRAIPWRRPIASLNYLLTSHVWRQDHNGFSHQDPGFIDHVVNKKAEVIRVYLPPDANTLLSVTDHCLRSKNYVNVIIAGKQPMPQWLTMGEAITHCTKGIGVWQWASNDAGEPDVVMGCAGDVPTLETLAAVDILHKLVPELRVRVVNVVDLMRLQPEREHPHGLSDKDFDALFTTNKPIVFAFHGYPWLIHRLTYRRTNHENLHVRGYKEEGTTTTPFDMTVLNDMDRFHLVADVAERVPLLAARAAAIRLAMETKRVEHREYIRKHGDDLPGVKGWTWHDGSRPWELEDRATP